MEESLSMTKRMKLSFMVVCIITLMFPSYGDKTAQAAGTFIMGGDVGMLKEVEQRGGKFYEGGVQKDALEILSSHGMNYVRLRLWVDPYDSLGNPYGGGTNDLAATIAVAKRAKAKGMGIFLDFHLSDHWADPGNQTKPKAWKNFTYSQLKTKVHDYTQSVITSMKAQNVMPGIVQMGNEIPGGVLWDDGKVSGSASNFTQLGELLSAGINGVHDALSTGEDIEIVLHLDHGGDNSLYTWWFDNIVAKGVDFDIIGLSYYPFWHGTMGELSYNLNNISKRYNKDVMIVETAYGFTLDDGDGLGNVFYTTEENVGGYPASPAGQVAYMRDLKEILKDVPNGHGRGIFWWEPTWLPVAGANWGSKAGALYNNDTGLLSNPWDNQTLFDFSGNALSSLSVFSENTPTNLLTNGSFETDVSTSTPTGWSVWASTSSNYSAIKTEQLGVVGDYKLTHWKSSAYTASTYQTKTGLANGTYSLTAWVLNSGGQNSLYMYAKDFGGTERQLALPVSTSSWVKVRIDNIAVSNGKIHIGFYSNANANNWINVDNVKLYKTN
jgi:arabinogalactan endo-1,4-beta-galactosidase